jgi:Domain of unknown function (DUF4262)
MCLRCDGYSEEEVWRATDLAIRTFGWSLVLVEDESPWLYTIGLLESFGHPELVVVDIKLERGELLIRSVAQMVEDTGGVDWRELKRRGIGLVTVHDDHLRSDLFGSWINFYDKVPASGSFLQVLPPKDWFCACHQSAGRRLDRRGSG